MAMISKKLLFLLAIAGGIFLSVQPGYAERLYSTGFELNSLAGNMEFATGPVTGLSIITSPVRSGTYALRHNNASAGCIEHSWLSADAEALVFVRFYIRIATTAPATLLDIQNAAGTSRASIRVTSNNKFQLWNGSAQVGSDSIAASTNTWYRLEIGYNSLCAATADTLTAKLNGQTFATSAGESLGTVSKFRLGSVAITSGIPDFYFDDVALNDYAKICQNSWPGSGKIVHLRPNADGDHGTNQWSLMSEVTPNDATNYAAITGAGEANAVDVNIDNSSDAGINSSDQITLVQVGARISAAGGQGNNVAFRIKSQASGMLWLSPTNTIGSASWWTHITSGPRNYQLDTYVDPQGNDPWTSDLLDTAQIGAYSPSDANPNPYVSALWALVEYVPASEDDAGSGADAGGTYASGYALNKYGASQGYIWSAGDVDYYLFSVTNGTRYEVVVNMPWGKNYDLDIRNASDVSKGTSTNTGDADDVVRFTADSTGTWAAKVYSGSDYDTKHPYAISIYPITYYYLRQDAPDDVAGANGDPSVATQCFKTIGGAFTQLKTDTSNTLWEKGKFVISLRDVNGSTYPSAALDGLKTNENGILQIENYTGESPVINSTTAIPLDIGSAAQADNNLNYVVVKGLIFKSNPATYQIFRHNQTTLTGGRLIIRDNVFDGQNIEKGASGSLWVRPMWIDTDIVNNEFKNFYDDDDSSPVMSIYNNTIPATMYPTFHFTGNSFHDNRDGALLYIFRAGGANNNPPRVYAERNVFYNNRNPTSSPRQCATINAGVGDPTISGAVAYIRNNFFYNNDWSYSAGYNHTTCLIYYGPANIYNNTFYGNKPLAADILVLTTASTGVSCKLNIIAPATGARYCLQVDSGAEPNFTSANNAFYADYAGNGYPSGSTFDTAENTETVGNWAGTAKTTSAWNAYSQNVNNGFTLGGPGLVSATDLHLTSASLCKDAGGTSGAEYDYDGEQRPMGSAYDIGADEYFEAAVSGGGGIRQQLIIIN